jgi:hypothetical protein
MKNERQNKSMVEKHQSKEITTYTDKGNQAYSM